MYRKRKQSGFTLLELLIVIAILGILSTLGVASLRGALAKGRDAKRKSDIKSLQTALELYYSDFSVYPDALSTLAPTYIKEIPEDPTSTQTYTFDHTDCSGGTITQANQRYLLTATLENQNDSDRTGSCGQMTGTPAAPAVFSVTQS